MELDDVVQAYAQAWCETDVDVRRKLLDACWADDGEYQDPTAFVHGRNALAAHIDGFFTDRFPGHRIVATSGADGHHGWFRFAWAMQDADGTTVLEGFDIGRLADDGRIGRIVGFFGPFPPLAPG